MKRVGSFLGDWWRLVVPYFKSEERWIAISLLIAAIVLTLSSVAVNVAYNEWSRRFFDTFQNKDEPGFWQEMINFSWIAGLTIAFSIARGLASPYLRLRWRRWLTKQYLAHWLDSRGYYRIELERRIDNADQRISEDLRQLGLYTMTLVVGVIDAVATLISFLFILWQLSGSVSLGFIGIDANVPGYMVWVALVYAFVGTWLANMVGRRLIPLNFAQQALEADFRFALVRVRENAEGIALYRGEPAEQENLVARYQAVFMNGWRVLYTSLQLAFYQTGYGQIAIIFPYLVTGPRFFAGAITLGVMTQTAQAFGQVQTALSFFIDNYATLAELRAVMDRLMGLQGAIDHKQDTAIDVAPETGRADVGAEGLTLGLPDGQALLRDATLVLPHGHSTLITGASGSGKSTLFRALAGIWPFGHGKVRVPARARALPAAEALYPDRHPAQRRALSRRAFAGERRRDRGRPRGRTARSSRPASRRGGALDLHAVGRRAAEARRGARLGIQARLAVPRRSHRIARRADGGGDLWRAEAAPSRYDHRVDRPPALAAPVARPPDRAQTRAGRGRAAGRRGRGVAGLMHTFVAAGAGFLLAVLWFDLMFDVQTRKHVGNPLPPEVLASISAYYRRVTTEAYPMNRLVALVMVLTLVAIVAQIVEATDPWWIGWGSLALAGSGFVPTLARTVPNARRLGSAKDPPDMQSTLARSICRDHLFSFARMSLVLGLQLSAV